MNISEVLRGVIQAVNATNSPFYFSTEGEDDWNKDWACLTCHYEEFGYSDSVSSDYEGVEKTSRETLMAAFPGIQVVYNDVGIPDSGLVLIVYPKVGRMWYEAIVTTGEYLKVAAAS